MQNYKITFNLYCKWQHTPPAYRLYFDDELMTERSYIWDNETHFLQECVPVWADPSITHKITIEQVGLSTGKFKVDNVESDNLKINFKFI